MTTMYIWGRRLGFMGNDQLTKLLLHCNGSDGATSMSDYSRSKHPITFVGTAQLDTAQKVLGVSSLLLDGNSDYISLPITSDFTFGTGDFTIDFRIRWNGAVPAGYIFNILGDATNSMELQVWADSKLRFYARRAGVVQAMIYTDTFTPNADTWYHFALVRSGANFYIFVNGVSQALSVSTAINGNDVGVTDGLGTDTFYIGSDGSASFFGGWLDEFRVCKGIARWTSNFNPMVIEYR